MAGIILRRLERRGISLRVAKARSCDTDESIFFNVNPPPPSGVMMLTVEKRRDHRNLLSSHAISVIPPLPNTITGGGVHVKNFFRLVSITATCFSNPETNLGARRSRRLLELRLPQIRKCHFFSDPCVFGYIF